jgi:hypothetical protein
MQAPSLSTTTATPSVQVPRNGNGSGEVSGRGLAHRPFAARLAIAVELATGERPLRPSLGQTAAACRVSPTQLRGAIKARANGGSHDATTEVFAKEHVRAAVAEVGMCKVIDLLSEIESE